MHSRTACMWQGSKVIGIFEQAVAVSAFALIAQAGIGDRLELALRPVAATGAGDAPLSRVRRDSDRRCGHPAI